MTAAAQTALDTGPEQQGADLSVNGLYRYSLWRVWDPDLPRAAFIGLNPSTADAANDDPTIRRCKRFARDWGYGGLTMLNLFALRSSDPRLLNLVEVDPVGELNDRYLRLETARAGIVIAAWGTFPKARDRAREIVELLDLDLHCLGLTRGGAPRHPLRLRTDTTPMPYEITRRAA